MNEIENLESIIRSYTNFFITFDIIVFSFAIVAVLLAIRFLKSKKRLEKTGKYLRAVIKGQEEERARIARELHDTVAQDLRYCKNLLEKEIPASHAEQNHCHPELDSGSAKEISSHVRNGNRNIQECLSILTKTLLQVRSMSGNLTPPDITKNDLCVNVLNLCQMINRQIQNDNKLALKDFRVKPENDTTHKQKNDTTCNSNNDKQVKNLEIRFVENGKADTSFLTEEENLNLFRIVQESLVNILRHADASEATVLIRNEVFDEKRGIYIFITDDGKGFDAEKPVPAGHFGLAGMNERANLIGAKLKITSEKGEGTQILVEKLAE